MNRVASRALIVLVLVLGLFAGSIVFVVDYSAGAQDWVIAGGSPYAYVKTETEAGTVKFVPKIGVVTDSEGLILLDTREDIQYCGDELIRMSMLHWVGDRRGNIRAPYFEHYKDQLTDYDLFNGAYQYADSTGQMILTLDPDLQKAAMEVMQGHVGTLAIYNYETGEILCAISTPTFDPDNAPYIDPDNPGDYAGVYVNNFLKSTYIPGSIFKIVTLAAALECIPDIQEQTFTCTGSMDMQGGDVTCSGVHGEQTLKEAFCNSCNCAFAQITLQVGRDRMNEYVKKFGLTEKLTFDGITTNACNYTTEDTSDEQFSWSGIGQYKDQINPCVFLRFVGAVGNGGVAVDPYVVSEVRFGDTVTHEGKSGGNTRILSEKTAEILSEYMGNNVVSKYGADNFWGYETCAKSGTGEVGGGNKPNAMFTGFVADTETPLAFIVCIENAGYGQRVCVPILSSVFQALKENGY